MRIPLLALLLIGASFAPARADELLGAHPIEAVCRSSVTAPCVARVGASLRSERSGEPLPGRQLWFTSGGVLICSSFTNEAGTASCFGVAPSGAALAVAGYRVSFAGDGRNAAASAVGGGPDALARDSWIGAQPLRTSASGLVEARQLVSVRPRSVP